MKKSEYGTHFVVRNAEKFKLIVNLLFHKIPVKYRLFLGLHLFLLMRIKGLFIRYMNVCLSSGSNSFSP